MFLPPAVEATSEEYEHLHAIAGDKDKVLELIVAARELADAVMEHFKVNVKKDGIRPSSRMLEALDRADLALGNELDDGPIEEPYPEGEGVEG